MSKKPSKPASKAPKGNLGVGLLGVGVDNEDGHTRLTKGEKFALVGGSQETHERMTETVLKTFEELKKRDRHLESVDPQELAEILHRSTPS